MRRGDLRTDSVSNIATVHFDELGEGFAPEYRSFGVYLFALI